MSYISPQPEQSSDEEIETLLNLSDLSIGDTYEVIRKNGLTTFVNFNLTDYFYTESEVDSLISIENLFDRVGTTISPHTTGDSLNMGTGDIINTGLISGGIVRTNNYQNALGTESFIWSVGDDWWELSNDLKVVGDLTIGNGTSGTFTFDGGTDLIATWDGSYYTISEDTTDWLSMDGETADFNGQTIYTTGITNTKDLYTEWAVIDLLDMPPAVTLPLTPYATTLRMFVEDIGGISFLSYLDSAGTKRKFVTSAGLTATRIPYATTNGHLTDKSNFTYAGDLLSVPYIASGGTITAGIGTNYQAVIGNNTGSYLTSYGAKFTWPDKGAEGYDATLTLNSTYVDEEETEYYYVVHYSDGYGDGEAPYDWWITENGLSNLNCAYATISGTSTWSGGWKIQPNIISIWDTTNGIAGNKYNTALGNPVMQWLTKKETLSYWILMDYPGHLNANMNPTAAWVKGADPEIPILGVMSTSLTSPGEGIFMWHDGTNPHIGWLEGYGGLRFGSGQAGIDYSIGIDGETNDFVATWMEDEDYLAISDDLLMNSTENIYFRDTAIHINSGTDGWLNLAADIGVEVNAPVLNTSDISADYISTKGNELLATDVIRHTITAGEATASTFTESWAKATRAKVANISIVWLDISATPDMLHFNVNDDVIGHNMNGTYDGTTITVYDTVPTWQEGDIITLEISYEK